MAKLIMRISLITIYTAGAAALFIPLFYGIVNAGMIIPMFAFAAIAAALIGGGLLKEHSNKFIWAADKMVIIFAALLLAVLTAASFVMGFGFKRSSGENVSVVIVPGAKIHGDYPSRMLKQRLDKALELLNKNERAVCVVSGGQGSDERRTEASVMKDYLASKGISERRIYEESRSVNTKQNFLYSAEIIKEKSLTGEIAVTTDFYHSYRCCLYAKRAGLSVGAYPCKTQTDLLPCQWIREIFAVIKAYIFA